MKVKDLIDLIKHENNEYAILVLTYMPSTNNYIPIVYEKDNNTNNWILDLEVKEISSNFLPNFPIEEYKSYLTFVKGMMRYIIKTKEEHK